MVLHVAGEEMSHLCGHKSHRDSILLEISVHRFYLQPHLRWDDIQCSTNHECGEHLHHVAIETKGSVHGHAVTG